MGAESQRDKLMRILKCTAQEADEIIKADKAIDRGERMEFDLSPEEEKKAKKYINSTTKTMPKTERKSKENLEKETIIAKIANFLTEKGYENVEITNKSRQIALKTKDKSFELTLIEKRKPKS